MIVLTKFLILFFLFFKVNSELRIPLTYFPKHKYNDSTPSTIMENIINQRVYANINIGTPIQEIQIPLLFDTNEFIIGDNPKEKFDEKSFSDLKFYNPEISDSYGEEEDAYDEFCGVYFGYALHVRDSIYFNNKNETFQFFIPLSYKEVVSGGIGMQLQSTYTVCDNTLLRSRSFFELVKSKNLTNKYDWSIFYDSKEYKKEEGGFLLMGALLHELNSDLGYYKKEEFQEKNLVKIYMKNGATLEFLLDKVYGSYGNNISNIIDDFPSDRKDIKNIKLDFNNGGIQVPNYLYKYYENSFKVFYSNEICFNKTFSDFSNKYFYCKKEILKNIDKIKETFPVIYFQSNDLNYNFTLDFDDLVLENGDNVYFLLYFYSEHWIMGKPFLKKYQFSFNYDKKNIQFYQIYSPSEGPSRSDDNNPKRDGDNKIPRWILAVSIVGTFLVVALISFLIFKFYLMGKCLRKKRANELADDDYEYKSKDDEKNDTEKSENKEKEEKEEKTQDSDNQQNIDEKNSLGINFEE